MYWSLYLLNTTFFVILFRFNMLILHIYIFNCDFIGLVAY
uniref:50S ribosomal protein L24 n=1 Tax=Vertebrata lanosa TaxID=1261582 RepID=A0A0B5W2N0_9FLOR|nr:50S ribosomal protein L24 [Vertebrata lanosa]AJH65919.1 50S ribosomal protein L24 [Vertebrata lanosa]